MDKLYCYFPLSCLFIKNIFIADSPNHQNKGNASEKNVRNVSAAKKTILSKTRAKSMAHDIVVVREANKKAEIDPDIQRLQVNTAIIQ